MLLNIDDSKISMDLQKLSSNLELWYKANKHYGYTIETEKGHVDFSPKSIARIAMKAAMTPIAIPMIHMIYKFKGRPVKPHEKHEDLIDYFVLSFIRYIALFNEDKIYVKTVECSGSDERTVVSITTIIPSTPTENERREIGPGSTGGAAYVRGGENGYGENETNKGNYQEETTSTALA